MKFDVFTWDEVKPNEKIQAPKGKLRLHVSAASPLYLEVEGVEALAGVGTSFDLEVAQAVTFRVEAGKGVRVFLHRPYGTVVEAEGEVYTNIDRMPKESGMLAEVTRARRQLEIERRQMLAEIRAEGAKAKAGLRKSLAADVPQEGGVAALVPEADPKEADAKPVAPKEGGAK